MEEKAVSKAQQKFFGMVRAKQKGEMPNASPEVKKAAASMSKKDVKDFAATKHKDLPAKKEGFAVKYNNPGHEKHGREKHFDNKMSADKHAARGNKVDKVGGKYTVHKTNQKGHTVEATMADKNGPGKGKDMRDMSKLDHAKARDYHQYRVKTKGDYHSKMAKIHHANAIGGSSMLHKEGYIGAKGEKGRDYHNAGTFDKATAYGHAKKHNGVVHKDPSGKYLVKHGKGKYVGEENIKELSPDTVKRYRDKASDDQPRQKRIAHDYATRTGDNKSDWTDKMAKVHQRAADNRTKGIAQANKKLGGKDKKLGEKEDPCWKGYQMVGMKKKNGKTVPNCVPEHTSIEEKTVNELAPLIGLAARGLATAAGGALAKNAAGTAAKKVGASIAKKVATGAAVGAAGAVGRAGANKLMNKNTDKKEDANTAALHRKGVADAQKDMVDAERKGDHHGMQRAMKRLAFHRKAGNKASQQTEETKLSFSELTDKQRAEIEKRKAARMQTRGARRGPAKGTAPKKADTTGAIKAPDFQKGDPDKHMIMQLRKAQDSHKMGRDMELSFRRGKGVASGKDIGHVLKYHDMLKKNDDKRKLMHSISKGGVDAIAKHAANFRKATGVK